MLTRRRANAVILSAGMAAAVQSPAPGETSRALPPPRQDGGKPLMEALKLRRSTRVYSSHLLSPQIISDLLWAAFGINRPSGDRTAPYWRHIMVIDIYAAMADGVVALRPEGAGPPPASEGRPSRLERDPGFRRCRAAEPHLCRPRRADDRRRPGGATPVRFGGRLLHRTERLSFLRLGGARDRVPRLRQSGEARRGDEPAGRAVRDLRADGRLSRVTGE